MRRIEICDKLAPCPLCGAPSKWHIKRHTHPRDFGGIVEVVRTVHHCEKCNHFFITPTAEKFIAENGRYTARAKAAIMALAYSFDTLRLWQNAVFEKIGLVVAINTLHSWRIDNELSALN